MESERKNYLLFKFLNDDYTHQELEELFTYTKSLGKDRAIEEGLEAVWNKYPPSHLMNELKSEKIFYSLLTAADRIETSRIVYKKTLILRIAAIFIGIVIFTGIASALLTDKYKVETTNYGKTKSIILPDGSKVTLNSNSSIKYLNNWDDNKTRLVRLEGEAYFDVIHKNNNQKFIVETKDVKVEVLGTEFNVVSRQTRSYVVLKKGKVRLDLAGKERLVMNPGELVEINPGQASFNKKVVNTENYLSWRKNVLTFKATSLKEIATIIEENYNLKISIPDKKLASERFTGAIPVNEDVDVLLTMLSKSYHFEIKKTSYAIVFESKPGH